MKDAVKPVQLLEAPAMNAEQLADRNTKLTAALAALLNCAELNQDSMEDDTRAAVVDAQALLEHA